MRTVTSRNIGSSRSGRDLAPFDPFASLLSLTALALLALLAASLSGCATPKAATQASVVSETDFARLAASQIQPVDEARAQLGMAQDELGRAKLGVVTGQHEGALARADQAAASANLSRAAAETKVGQDSNEPAQVRQARDDTLVAERGKAVADARLAYAKKLATSGAAQVAAAERKVDLMTARVNLAKLQALRDAGVAAAGKYDREAALRSVTDAQAAHERAMATAAEAARETSVAAEQLHALAHPGDGATGR